jgi:hypothetical protein
VLRVPLAQLAIGLATLAGYRRSGVWGAFQAVSLVVRGRASAWTLLRFPA